MLAMFFFAFDKRTKHEQNASQHTQEEEQRLNGNGSRMDLKHVYFAAPWRQWAYGREKAGGLQDEGAPDAGWEVCLQNLSTKIYAGGVCQGLIF